MITSSRTTRCTTYKLGIRYGPADLVNDDVCEDFVEGHLVRRVRYISARVKERRGEGGREGGERRGEERGEREMDNKRRLKGYIIVELLDRETTPVALRPLPATIAVKRNDPNPPASTACCAV